MPGSRSTQTTQQTRSTSAEDTPLLNQIRNQTSNLIADPSNFTQQYSDATRNAGSAFEQMGQTPGMQGNVLPGLMDMAQQGYGTGAGTLQQAAGGGFMGGNDANLMNSLQYAGEDAINSLKGQFAAQGRDLGSASFGAGLGRSLGKLYSDATTQQYNTDQAQRLAAAGQLNNSGSLAAGFAQQGDNAEAQRAQLGLMGGQIQDQMLNAGRLGAIGANQYGAQIATPIAGLSGSTNGTTTQQQSANPLGMAMGLGSMMFGGGANSMMSGLRGFFG